MPLCSMGNACLIKALAAKTGQDVILFGLDGISYYGRLQDVDEYGIAS